MSIKSLHRIFYLCIVGLQVSCMPNDRFGRFQVTAETRIPVVVPHVGVFALPPEPLPVTRIPVVVPHVGVFALPPEPPNPSSPMLRFLKKKIAKRVPVWGVLAAVTAVTAVTAIVGGVIGWQYSNNPDDPASDPPATALAISPAGGSSLSAYSSTTLASLATSVAIPIIQRLYNCPCLQAAQSPEIEKKQDTKKLIQAMDNREFCKVKKILCNHPTIIHQRDEQGNLDHSLTKKAFSDSVTGLQSVHEDQYTETATAIDAWIEAETDFKALLFCSQSSLLHEISLCSGQHDGDGSNRPCQGYKPYIVRYTLGKNRIDLHRDLEVHDLRYNLLQSCLQHNCTSNKKRLSATLYIAKKISEYAHSCMETSQPNLGAKRKKRNAKNTVRYVFAERAK